MNINFLSYILSSILGILVGTITGLIPGLHINMVSITVASFFYSFNTFLPIIFIISMSIVHTFIDFIPSILLGSPDYDTTLSILPGHQLLLKGKGYEAIMYTLYGSFIGLIIILLLTLPSIILLPLAYPYLKKVIFYVLLLSSIYLIIREKNKILSFIIFILSGFIGLSTLNLNLNQPLLPLLTGLFGSSSLIVSILKKQKLPKQRVSRVKLRIREIKKVIFATSLVSPLCSFLPSLGSGQAAVISSDIVKEDDKRKFLILLGSINTIVMGMSFISFYTLNIKRTGSVVAISQLINNLTKQQFFYILLIIFFSGIFAFYIGKFLTKFLVKKISKINYQKLSVIILIFITSLVLYFSSFIGLLIFITSTFLGIFTILSNQRRTLLMGSLMIPSLLIYFPL